jgi:hypothetical protein
MRIPENVFSYFWTLSDFRGAKNGQKISSPTTPATVIADPLSSNDDFEILQIYLMDESTKPMSSELLNKATVGSTTLYSAFELFAQTICSFWTEFLVAPANIQLQEESWTLFVEILSCHVKHGEISNGTWLKCLSNICTTAKTSKILIASLCLFLDIAEKLPLRIPDSFSIVIIGKV